MPVLVCSLGLLLIVLVVLDVLLTTLTVRGGGPLTGRVSSGLWAMLLWVHRRRTNHRVLAASGWVILIGIALIWVLLTWAGWTLVFSAFEPAIVNGQTKLPADLWERIYFTGYTLFTLGMGDFQPQGAPWQVATAIASANGFFLITIAITYLLPVVSAATQKRQLATYISSLGGTSDEILVRAWNGQNFGQLDQHLIALTPMVASMGSAHLAYPVLHYFHSLDCSRAFALSLAALDEALILLQYGVPVAHQPDRAALGPARRAVAAFLQTLSSDYIRAESQTPPLPALDLLRTANIPTVSPDQFWEVTKPVTRRRQFLLALVRNDGWKWDAIASSKTTGRGQELDDATLVDEVLLD